MILHGHQSTCFCWDAAIAMMSRALSYVLEALIHRRAQIKV